jgi:hypothetical protein
MNTKMVLKDLNASVRGAKVLNDVLNTVRSIDRSVHTPNAAERYKKLQRQPIA